MITIYLFISAPKSRLNHRIPPIYNQNCLGKNIIQSSEIDIILCDIREELQHSTVYKG